MDKGLVVFSLSAVLVACASSPMENKTLEWPQDYRNLGAPEGFNPPEKPGNLKNCITDIVNTEIGLRYIAYPGKYEAVDEWMKSGNHPPKYHRRWVVLEPARTIEIVLGSTKDNIVIPKEDLCQEN